MKSDYHKQFRPWSKFSSPEKKIKNCAFFTECINDILNVYKWLYKLIAQCRKLNEEKMLALKVAYFCKLLLFDFGFVDKNLLVPVEIFT